MDNLRKRLLSKIERGNSAKVGINLPGKSGIVEIQISPVVQPKEYGLNEDERWLGCQCLEGRIMSKDEISMLWTR
jgi:hypothetical protein